MWDDVPSAEIERMSVGRRQCHCCDCVWCDFDIGTIEVAIAGTFSLFEEYESATDPGYYDRRTFSGSYSTTGTLTQVPFSRDPFPPALAAGEFRWDNDGIIRTVNGHCYGHINRMDYNSGYISAVTDYFVLATAANVRTLVVAVEDPNVIISDTTADAHLGYGFGSSYDFATTYKWTMSSGMISDFLYIGDTDGTANLINSTSQAQPAGYVYGNYATGAKAHPRGFYTSTTDDGFSSGGGAVFTNFDHTYTVNATVNGAGLVNCVPATVIVI